MSGDPREASASLAVGQVGSIFRAAWCLALAGFGLCLCTLSWILRAQPADRGMGLFGMGGSGLRAASWGGFAALCLLAASTAALCLAAALFVRWRCPSIAERWLLWLTVAAWLGLALLMRAAGT